MRDDRSGSMEERITRQVTSISKGPPQSSRRSGGDRTALAGSRDLVQLNCSDSKAPPKTHWWATLESKPGGSGRGCSFPHHHYDAQRHHQSRETGPSNVTVPESVVRPFENALLNFLIDLYHGSCVPPTHAQGEKCMMIDHQLAYHSVPDTSSK